MSKRDEILAKVAAGDLPVEEASKLLDQLEPPRGRLYCKVSPKGAMSLYGLQRMPVTLYIEQWQRLLDFSDELGGAMLHVFLTERLRDEVPFSSPGELVAQIEEDIQRARELLGAR